MVRGNGADFDIKTQQQLADNRADRHHMRQVGHQQSCTHFFCTICIRVGHKVSLSEIEPDADGDTSKTYFMTETHIDLLVHTHRQKTIIIYKSHKG